MTCGLNAIPFGQYWPRACSPLEPLFLPNVPPGWASTRGYKNRTLLFRPILSGFASSFGRSWNTILCPEHARSCTQHPGLSIYSGTPNFPHDGNEGPVSPGGLVSNASRLPVWNREVQRYPDHQAHLAQNHGIMGSSAQLSTMPGQSGFLTNIYYMNRDANQNHNLNE